MRGTVAMGRSRERSRSHGRRWHHQCTVGFMGASRQRSSLLWVFRILRIPFNVRLMSTCLRETCVIECNPHNDNSIKENKPVWRLLADMTPDEIVSLCDFR